MKVTMSYGGKEVTHDRIERVELEKRGQGVGPMVHLYNKPPKDPSRAHFPKRSTRGTLVSIKE